MVIEVGSTAELLSAVAAAKGGETIELEPGVYDGLILISMRDFDPPIRITSAHPAEPAIFTGRMLIRDTSGVQIDSVEFRLGDKEPRSWIAQVHLERTQHVEVRDVTIEGRVAAPVEGVPPDEIEAEGYTLSVLVEGYAFGSGITVRESSDVALSGLDISIVEAGIGLSGVERVSLTNSHLHDIRRDGVAITEASDVRIADNLFHSFRPMQQLGNQSIWDHSDFIQYWGVTGTRGIDGLEISGNAMFEGSGGKMQGIFGRMALRAGEEPMPFRNFSVHDNVVIVSALNGISLSDLAESEVYGNTLLPAAFNAASTPGSNGAALLRFPSDVRIDPATGLRVPIRLPEDVSVHGNLLATRDGQPQISFPAVLESDYAARGIEIGSNPTFSIDPASPGFWAARLGVEADRAWLDIAALTGRPDGGAAPLADWIVETAAKVSWTREGWVHGGEGDDRLVAARSETTGESSVYGEAGDDTLIGGAGDDTLVAGAGSDRMTGEGGGDVFALAAGALSSGETDTITDFDFAEGDALLMNAGFASGTFNDTLDPANRLESGLGGRFAFLDSDADLREIALHPGVTIVETGAGDSEIRFDFNRDGVLDYALRLLGYRIGSGQAGTDDGAGGIGSGDGSVVVEPDEGRDDIVEEVLEGPVIVAAADTPLLVAASNLAAGATILLKGFPAGFFAGSALIAPSWVTDGSAVLISSTADLAMLAATASVFVRAPDDETVEFAVGTGAPAVSMRIEGLAAGEAWRIALGDPGAQTGAGTGGAGNVRGGAGDDVLLGGVRADRLVGYAGDDWLEGGAGADYLHGCGGSDTLVGGDGGDRFVVFAGELTPGDRTVFADINFSEGDNIYFGQFAQDAFAVVDKQDRFSLRSVDQLVALGEADWIEVERNFVGVTLTLGTSVGAHRFLFMLDDATLARADELLGG